LRLTNTPLALTHCVVDSNAGVAGGGIYSDSALLLQDCSLINNTAVFSQQGNAGAVQGGGLFSAGGVFTLQSCLVSNNTAVMSPRAQRTKSARVGASTARRGCSP